MSSWEMTQGRPSPRRELQGPRPAPLTVHKDSFKIKKQGMGASGGGQSAAPPAPPRPPVIIYTVSPKVIHTNPGDFMALVQRLTGQEHCAGASAGAGDPMSPAARLAAIEKQDRLPRKVEMMDVEMESKGGILSPVPTTLPAISPGFFSPASVDPNSLSFLHELSPAFHGHRSYVESTFHNLLSTPTNPSPGAWDLFNQFQDL